MNDNNIAKKIKEAANIIWIIGILGSAITSVIYCIAYRYNKEGVTLIAILIIALGIFISWITSILMYAWGHFIENTDIISGRKTLDEIKKEEKDKNTNTSK